MLEIGSIVSGTCISAEIADALLWELKNQSAAQHTALCEEYAKGVDLVENYEGYDAEDMDEVGYLLEALYDALEDFVPAYCYLGSHEGDGADTGVWVAWDSLESDCLGEVVKVDAGDEWPEDLDGAGYVLEVNDHGNATLYSADHTEQWSCV